MMQLRMVMFFFCLLPSFFSFSGCKRSQVSKQSLQQQTRTQLKTLDIQLPSVSKEVSTKKLGDAVFVLISASGVYVRGEKTVSLNNFRIRQQDKTETGRRKFQQRLKVAMTHALKKQKEKMVVLMMDKRVPGSTYVSLLWIGAMGSANEYHWGVCVKTKQTKQCLLRVFTLSFAKQRKSPKAGKKWSAVIPSRSKNPFKQTEAFANKKGSEESKEELVEIPKRLSFYFHKSWWYPKSDSLLLPRICSFSYLRSSTSPHIRKKHFFHCLQQLKKKYLALQIGDICLPQDKEQEMFSQHLLELIAMLKSRVRKKPWFREVNMVVCMF